MDNPKSLRLKISMPHVASQWEEGQRGSYGERLSRGPARKSTEYLRPVAIPPCRPNRRIKQNPSMSLLTPGSDHWDFGSIRHIRQCSDNKTPISAVESVFELPSATTYYSPNSSTHSSFIAELEDTSKVALQSLVTLSSPFKSPTISNSCMEFKSAQMTSRAVIKVVDETIAAIEESNRVLLSRAVAAEQTAKLLREQNSQLELRIRQYNRPKTAPSQPSQRNLPHHQPSYSQAARRPEMSEYRDPTPLSTFNAQIDKLLLPAPPNRETRPRDPALYPKPHTLIPRGLALKPAPLSADDSSIYTPTRLSAPPKHHHQKLPSSSHHSRSSSHPTQLHPATQTPYQTPNPPPIPNMEISPPLPGTISRHEVILSGTRLSSTQRAKTISLDEARRRAKPLPPLGPMSPSVLKGVVEIGTPRGVDEFGRELRFVESVKKGRKEGRTRGLSGLFRWKRNKYEGLCGRERGRERVG